MSTPTTDLARYMADAWNAGDPQRVIELAAQTPQVDGGDVGDVGNADVLLFLGLAQQATQQPAQAAATFRQLTQLQPEVPAHWNNLAVTCRQAGDLMGAEEALLRARALAPLDAEVLYNLGLLYSQQRRWLLARDSLLEAVQLAPHFIEARLQAAYACHVCGDTTQQEAMLADAANWPAQPAEQALLLAPMLSLHGDLDAALHILAHALLPVEPAAAAMRWRITAQRVLLFERNNQIDAAQRELGNLPTAMLDDLAADTQQAGADICRAHAAMALRTGAYAQAEAMYQRVLHFANDDAGRASASFGLAAARDRQGRYAAAWQALGVAHAAQLDVAASVMPELLANDSQPLQMTGSVSARAGCATWTLQPAPARGQSPVFVVGFPRSGTTLLEQMLDAHPDFQSMDERAFIHELIERMQLAGQTYPDDLANLSPEDAGQLRSLYLRMVGHVLPDLGARHLVDKNPLNMLCLPMIMRLFPHARIILCLRHPCDVLLSCSMQPFRSPAFMVLCSSLQRLAHGYAQAFEQWVGDVQVLAPHVLEWRYESVVTRFDEQVVRLGQFLQTADTAPMTRFAQHARNKRFISTPSYAQVTQDVHRKRVGRWQNYREQLAPVLPVLQPWIERFGYDT